MAYFNSVSLIITTYNNPHYLKLVLESVRRQTVIPIEIVVADDGSSEETLSVVEAFGKTTDVAIKHVWHEDKGFRAALIRNRASSHSSGDVLVFVDGDMILHSHFLEDHLTFSKPNRFLQGSRVILSSELSERIHSLDDMNFTPFTKGVKNSIFALRSFFIASFHRSKTDPLRGVRTCNFSVPRDCFIETNGFDSRFVGWGREDSELVARLQNQGFKRKDIKNCAIAYHLYHVENTRASLEKNHERLMATMNSKLKVTEDGLRNLDSDFKLTEFNC